MLPEAAQLARLLLAATDKSYLKQKARSTLVTAEAWLIVGVMAAVALVFFLIAAFMGLKEVLPGWAAALIVGLIAALVAGIAFLVARRQSREVPLPRNTLVEDFAERPEDAAAAVLGPLIDEAVKATRERPGETMMLAVAAGMLAGRLFRRDSLLGRGRR